MSKTYKKITKKEERKVVDEVYCDNCKEDIPCGYTCGFGVSFILNDSKCKNCGGKQWDFCSYECLKEFVNKRLNRLR
ncbi:MAG: hypothetical protein ACOC1X_03720 [Promethearchaeota archaeon]